VQVRALVVMAGRASPTVRAPAAVTQMFEAAVSVVLHQQGSSTTSTAREPGSLQIALQTLGACRVYLPRRVELFKCELSFGERCTAPRL
jgi:hypothetical protein